MSRDKEYTVLVQVVLLEEIIDEIEKNPTLNTDTRIVKWLKDKKDVIHRTILD